jgi:1,4-dihydroxy-2-naphthoyl-CoA hydrolase
MINTEIFTLEKLNKMNENTIVSHLNIKITNVGKDFVEGVMPVDNTTKQLHGILHGGASVVLAETLGSIASNICLDYNKQYSVGIEVNANHLKSVTSGYVKGIAKPLKIGRKIHVWEIHIYNEDDDLVCVSRLTLAVLNK